MAESIGFAFSHVHRTVVESTIHRGAIAPPVIKPGWWWVTCDAHDNVIVTAHDGSNLARTSFESGTLSGYAITTEQWTAIAQGIRAVRGEANAAMPAVAPPAQPKRLRGPKLVLVAIVGFVLIGGGVVGLFLWQQQKIKHHGYNLSVGDACYFSVECSTNNCDDGHCRSNPGDRIEGASCTVDGNCHSGVCRDGLCFVRRAHGSLCRKDEDCLSDTCVNHQRCE